MIGFAGVIFTLWYNGKLAREQQDDERDHERETLRIALSEELKINRDSLERNAKMLRGDKPAGGALIPTDLMDDAYRAFMPKIGLLTEIQVSKVMVAYLSLRTYNAKLFLIGVPVSTSPRHVNVSKDWLDGLAGTQENLLGTIHEAISALK